MNNIHYMMKNIPEWLYYQEIDKSVWIIAG